MMRTRSQARLESVPKERNPPTASNRKRRAERHDIRDGEAPAPGRREVKTRAEERDNRDGDAPANGRLEGQTQGEEHDILIWGGEQPFGQAVSAHYPNTPPTSDPRILWPDGWITERCMEEALPKDLLRRMVAPTDGKKKALLWKEHQYLEPNKLKPWEDIWPSIDHCLKSFDRFLIPLNIPLAAQRGYHWGSVLVDRVPKRIYVFDPLGGTQATVGEFAKAWLIANDDDDDENWDIVDISYSAQRDGVSCGLWVIALAYYWLGEDSPTKVLTAESMAWTKKVQDNAAQLRGHLGTPLDTSNEAAVAQKHHETQHLFRGMFCNQDSAAGELDRAPPQQLNRPPPQQLSAPTTVAPAAAPIDRPPSQQPDGDQVAAAKTKQQAKKELAQKRMAAWQRYENDGGLKAGDVCWTRMPRQKDVLNELYRHDGIVYQGQQFENSQALELAVAELAYVLNDVAGCPKNGGGGSAEKGKKSFELSASKIRINAVTVLGSENVKLSERRNVDVGVAWEVTLVSKPSRNVVGLKMRDLFRGDNALRQRQEVAPRKVKFGDWFQSMMDKGQSLTDEGAPANAAERELAAKENAGPTPNASQQQEPGADGQAKGHSRRSNFAYSARQLAPILLQHAFGKQKLTFKWSKAIIETCLGGAGPSCESLIRSTRKIAKARERTGVLGRLRGIMQLFRKAGHFVKFQEATREDMERAIKKNAERDHYNQVRELDENKGKRFAQLPRFTAEKWHEWLDDPENKAIYSMLNTPTVGALFMSLIFVPKESMEVSPNLNQLYALDATFTNTKVMYSAYAYTSNGTNSVLGHMLTIENETKNGWRTFLEGLKEAHTADVIDKSNAVFLMDQFPGLRATFYEVFKFAKPFWCSWHRYDNLAKTNKKVAKAFRAAVHATSTTAVDDILDKLSDRERDMIVLNHANPRRTAVPLDEQFPAYAKQENNACMLGRSTTQVRFSFLLLVFFTDWFLTCHFGDCFDARPCRSSLKA